MKLKPEIKEIICDFIGAQNKNPMISLCDDEFLPEPHFGSVRYDRFFVFYSLSAVYPCMMVNGRFHLIKLSPN